MRILDDWIHRQLNQFGNVAISGPFSPISAVSDAENVNYWPFNGFEIFFLNGTNWWEFWATEFIVNWINLATLQFRIHSARFQQFQMLKMSIIDRWMNSNIYKWDELIESLKNGTMQRRIRTDCHLFSHRPIKLKDRDNKKKNVLIMKLIDNWFKCDFLFSWFAFNGDGRRGWATASMTSTTSSTSKCPHCWKPTTTTTVSTPTIGPTPNSPVSFVNELMTWINAH